jgi:hypothetical protein
VTGPDPREWLYLRVGLVVVVSVILVDAAVWRLHDRTHRTPSRLESTLGCLQDQKGVPTTVPAGDPLSATAGAGSLRTTVEGNGVIVALASSPQQAARIASSFTAVGGDLTGRLDLRDRTVYVWDLPSSPTQRQTMYDCQY